jgi:hypothetical protein
LPYFSNTVRVTTLSIGAVSETRFGLFISWNRIQSNRTGSTNQTEEKYPAVPFFIIHVGGGGSMNIM